MMVEYWGRDDGGILVTTCSYNRYNVRQLCLVSQ